MKTEVQKKTTIKNGMIYHEISKELYIQHKKDNWTDRRIQGRYGMSTYQITKWKQENFTQEELKALSLTGLHIANVKKTKEKREENNMPNKKVSNSSELQEKYADAKKTIDELATEKELAYQKAKEWEQKYKDAVAEFTEDERKADLEFDSLRKKYEAAQKEWANMKDTKVNLDCENENLKQGIKELESKINQLLLQIEEMKRITNPLRDLVRVMI